MIHPEMISLSLKPFYSDDNIIVVNLMSKILNIDEFNDPNEVKVVVDNSSNAIYFSREPIPSRKKGYDKVPMFKQVCVIPFKRDYLLEFNETQQTTLEKIESIDMLRVIENGKNVKMVLSDKVTYSVDTDLDLRNVEKKMKNDELISKYV